MVKGSASVKTESAMEPPASRWGVPSGGRLDQGEAFRLFLAGELVTAKEMAIRFQEDGRFCVREEDLLDPDSPEREEGFPVVLVEGVEGPFFRPTHALAFMEEWLRLTPEEEAEMERDRLEEERERQERLAKIQWRLEHPTPKTLIGSMERICDAAVTVIRENLQHQNKKVRAAAMEQAHIVQQGTRMLLPREEMGKVECFS